MLEERRKRWGRRLRPAPPPDRGHQVAGGGGVIGCQRGGGVGQHRGGGVGQRRAPATTSGDLSHARRFGGRGCRQSGRGSGRDGVVKGARLWGRLVEDARSADDGDGPFRRRPSGQSGRDPVNLGTACRRDHGLNPRPCLGPAGRPTVGPDPALGPAARTSGTAALAAGAVSAGSGTSTPTDLAAVSSAPAVGIAPTTVPTTSAAGPNGAGPLVALGDTWLWTSSGWVEVRAGQPAASGRAKPSSPPARSGAAMSYDSATGDVVLFSGESGPVGSGSADLLSDTWLWNGSSWSQPKTKTEPPPRSGGASTDDPNLGGVLLLGGSGATGPLAGNWVWSDNGWSKLSTTAAMPPLEGLTAAFSSALGEVVAFGGATSGSQVLGDTFLLGTAQPTRRGQDRRPARRPLRPPGSVRHPAHHFHDRCLLLHHHIRIWRRPGWRNPGYRPPHRRPLSGPGRRPTGRSPAGAFARERPCRSPSTPSPTFWRPSGPMPPADSRPPWPSRPRPRRGTHHLMASGLNAAGRLAELEASVRILGGSGSSSPTAVETGVMLAVAVGIPVAAWLSMSGYGWLRRRTRRPAGRPV